MYELKKTTKTDQRRLTEDSYNKGRTIRVGPEGNLLIDNSSGLSFDDVRALTDENMFANIANNYLIFQNDQNRATLHIENGDLSTITISGFTGIKQNKNSPLSAHKLLRLDQNQAIVHGNDHTITYIHTAGGNKTTEGSGLVTPFGEFSDNYNIKGFGVNVAIEVDFEKISHGGVIESVDHKGDNLAELLYYSPKLAKVHFADREYALKLKTDMQSLR